MRWAGSRPWSCICVVAALAGCASTGSHAQQGPVSTAPNARIVQGEAVDEAPLLPEPGDIWAHIVPGRGAADRPSPQPAPAPGAGPVAQRPVLPSPKPAPTARRSQPARTLPADTIEPGGQPGVQVQLTAASSQQKALGEWALLGKRQPELLRGHPPEIVELEAGGHTRWRLRAGGFVNTAAAQTFCEQVKAAGLDCWVVGRAM